MSDNRLNLTGLTYFYNRLKQVFATQTALNTLSDRVDDIVAEGGEPNVIETVKVDGTALTPDAQKAVNIDLSGKQDTLVSGTNIKTINSLSLLGSGNLDINDVFVAVRGSTTYAELDAAVQAGKAIFYKSGTYLQPTLSVVLSAPEIGYLISALDFFGGYSTVGVYSLTSADVWQALNSYPLATVQNLTDGLATKQDTLVSGTNIKTVNSVSLLGSGDISISDVYVATYNTTSYADVRAAFDAGKTIVIDFGGYYAVPVRALSSVAELLFEVVVGASTPTVKTYLLSDEGWLEMSSTALATATAIPDSTSDLNNDGDGNSPFATQAYVGQNGGKIDTISVNGTQQTITNKNVDITVPTKVSDLTNDGDGTQGSAFATTDDVTDAIDARISSTYKAKGSVAFANLPALAAANEGSVYNVTDSFTTTADFVEGAGNTYPAGTNVVIINTGTEQSPVYKYDVLAGFVDLSDYWNSTNLTAITTAEIDAMMAS